MANNDQAGDPDVQLKKRARRRLTGAIALVLLAVIVLPMVMDHEPRPVGPEIQVQIPSQSAPPVAAKALAARPADSSAKVATDTVPAPAKATAEEAKSVASPPKPEPVPAKTDPVPAKTDPAPARKVEKVESERALAALGGKAPSAAGNGEWVVKLGAYREAGNVKVLLAKLKEMGIPAYTEKLDSPQGPRIRVRAGPFGDRDAANRAQARIKTIGVDGPVESKS